MTSNTATAQNLWSVGNGRSTRGLDRLAGMQRTHYFQEDRRLERDSAHVAAPAIDTDPRHMRGSSVPGLGLVQFNPMVWVFPSALAAALVALSQGMNGETTLHTDQLADGTVAMTLGEYGPNKGALQAAFERAQTLVDGGRENEPLENIFVDGLRRGKLDEFLVPELPIPGYAVVQFPVQIEPEDRIALTAGDALALRDFIGGRPIPWLETKAQVEAPPFTGPFRTPHLFYNPKTGDSVEVREITPADRNHAAAIAQRYTDELARDPNNLNRPWGRIIVPAEASDS